MRLISLLLVFEIVASLPARAQTSAQYSFAWNQLQVADTAIDKGTPASYRRARDILARQLRFYSDAHDLYNLAWVHNAFGRILGAEGKADSAIAEYREAALLSRMVRDTNGVLANVNNVAWQFYRLSLNDSALATLDQVMPLVNGRPPTKFSNRIIISLGRVHGAMGHLPIALEHFKRADSIAAAVETPARRRWISYYSAAAYTSAKRFDSATILLRALREVAKTAGDDSLDATIVASLGTARLGQRDYEGGMTLLKAAVAQALRLRRYSDAESWLSRIASVYGDSIHNSDSAMVYYRAASVQASRTDDIWSEAYVASQIAAIYKERKLRDSALVVYQRAIDLFHEAGLHRFEPTSEINVGALLIDVGRTDDAEDHFVTALRLARAYDRKASEASALINLGRVSISTDSSLHVTQRALAIYRELNDTAGQVAAINNIGTSYEDLKLLDSALVYYRQSLRLSTGSPGADTSLALANVGDVLEAQNQLDSAAVYYGRAAAAARHDNNLKRLALAFEDIAYVEQYRRKTIDLVTAAAYWDSAAAIRESMRDRLRVSDDVSRVSIAESGATTYDNWTLAMLGRGRDLGKESAVYAGLAVAERGRSRQLIDMLQTGRRRADTASANPFAAFVADSELVAEGRRFAEEATRTAAAAISYISTSDTLIIWLLQPHKAPQVFFDSISWADLDSLVDVARSGTGAVAARGVTVTKLEHSATDSARTISPAEGAAALANLGRRMLPATLLAQLPAQGEIVIVPHGPLTSLPFAALAIDSAGARMGLHYALRYTPSLRVLAAVEDSSGRLSRATLLRTLGASLVVANPTMPTVLTDDGDTQRLEPLRGAAVEGQRIAAVLSTSHLLTARTATKQTVLRLAGAAPIMHFATHGYSYSDDQRQRDSFIALAPSTRDDGLLTVGTVLDSLPPLRAELVVLSACQTALGDLMMAEGTVGLQRAFLAKGARTLLVSLWNVSDDATMRLMDGFYRHWLRDADSPSKAEALRRAQVDVGRIPKYRAAKYWAAFQLVGAH